MRARRDQGGQATVELALCLPLFALVVAAAVELMLLGGDQVRLWHAAREAARVGVVEHATDRIEAAAAGAGLAPLEVRVTPRASDRRLGEPLTVEIDYRPRGRVPLIGELLAGTTLHAGATMRIEQP